MEILIFVIGASLLLWMVSELVNDKYDFESEK